MKRGYKEKAVWLGKRSESCTSPFVKYSFQSHFNLYQHDTLLKYSTTLQIHVSTSNLPAIASWRVKKKNAGDPKRSSSMSESGDMHLMPRTSVDAMFLNGPDPAAWKIPKFNLFWGGLISGHENSVTSRISYCLLR